MTVQDRTKEFFAAIDSLQNRGSGAMQAAQLMQRLSASQQESKAPLLRREDSGINTLSGKSEFSRMAAQIAREISSTSSKLEKLAKLAKKKTLFDEKPDLEINELTQIIKDDISRISADIKNLEGFFKTGLNQSSSKQLKEHSQNIILSLQSKLANASFTFKDVLEIRSNNLKEQQQRRSQLSFSSPSNNVSSSNALVVHSAESALYQSNSHVSINMPAMQQQLISQQDTSYLDSRAEAIEGIERTINDLAGLFQQLTTMISAHDDLVRRIDYNVEDVNINIENAQHQLLRYMSSISSDRASNRNEVDFSISAQDFYTRLNSKEPETQSFSTYFILKGSVNEDEGYNSLLKALKQWKLPKSSSVPKILHQSWKSKSLPEQFNSWSQSCKSQNSNWLYKLWTDEQNRKLFADFYPTFLPVYDSFKQSIFKADSVRYLYMYIFGGVYIDLDTKCLRPYDKLFNIKDKLYIASMEVFDDVIDHKYPNAFLASTPGHPFWILVLSKIMKRQYLAQKGLFKRKDEAEHITGPAVLYESLTEYLRDWPTDDVYILPKDFIYPFSWAVNSNDEVVCGAKSGMFNETKCVDYYHSIGKKPFSVTFWSHTREENLHLSGLDLHVEY